MNIAPFGSAVDSTERPRSAIEVLELRRVEGHGNLRAFAKVKLGCVLIHGVRVIQQPSQAPWIALPQTPARKKADGSGAGWFPCIEITNRAVLDQLRAAVLEHWQSLEDFREHPGDQL